MTVQEAIIKANKDNSGISEADFISWLSDLDGQIYNDVLSGHEGAVAPDPVYDTNTALLVPAPYANDIYVEYLRARIYLSLQEAVKYNNCLMAHKEALSSFAAHYLRTHKPIQRYISGASV